MNNGFRAVLFDLDGTLLDSIRHIIDSYHHSLAAHGLPARTDAHWLAGIGTPLRVQFGDWAGDPELFEKLIATYRDYNISNHDSRVSCYPGVQEVVGEIKQRGFATGLVTSKQRAGAIRGLEFMGMSHLMDLIIAADDVTNPKPHPEPLLMAAEQLGADPREAIYVGDSVHDMISGKAAGMRTAAAMWGPFSREALERTEPDYWLGCPADLLSIVGPSAVTHNDPRD